MVVMTTTVQLTLFFVIRSAICVNYKTYKAARLYIINMSNILIVNMYKHATNIVGNNLPFKY